MVGKGDKPFLLGFGLFSVAFAVSFREHNLHFKQKAGWIWLVNGKQELLLRVSLFVFVCFWQMGDIDVNFI